MRCLGLVVVSCVITLAPRGGAQTSPPVLRGLDPVVLCRGKEEAGKDDLVVDHGSHRYRFATEANRAAFVAEPARYAIQLDGACARMGPRSGLGDAQRWHVHGERIYVFASDQCRAAFQQRPDACLDVATQPPTDAEGLAAAAELVARAVRAHGGADALRTMRTYRHEHTRPSADHGEQFRLLVRWPGDVRLEHDWRQGDKVWRYAQLVDAATGVFVDEGKPRTMGPDAHVEVWRELGHEPLVALRALLDGTATAAARGRREVLGGPVDELEVWQHGRTTFLGLDADGRIATARCRGRGPSLWFGAVELRFDEWLERGGVRVPTRVRGTFDGNAEPSFAEQRTGVEVNAALPDDTFRRPQ